MYTNIRFYIDDYKNPLKVKNYTPDVLVNLCIKNLPIRKNILTENEAKAIGLSVNTRDHYHEFGKEAYINAVASLDTPRAIFKNTINNNYLILTDMKDKNNNIIVVPIEIETITVINKNKLDINRVKTIYGYNRKHLDLNKYIKDNINANKLEKIYEKKNSSTNITSQLSSFMSNISQDNINVNCDISNNSNM